MAEGSFLLSLECSLCGRSLPADRLQTVCPAEGCGRPLLARYDLAVVRARLRPEDLAGRVASLWRYAELLPVADPACRLTLGEGFTPLLPARRLGMELGLERLYIKEESLNPTGSFKARGLCLAVSRALELGVEGVVLPSAGNAAGAAAAYAARAGLEARVFMPADVPPLFRRECLAFGAEVTLVEGLITDCGRLAAAAAREEGLFPLATLKEPYRLEGKKSMGFELFEQLGGELPQVVLYPAGGGTGLVGMWKAFAELEELGWIGPERPRMVAVQAAGCAPIVRAFTEGREFARSWEGAETVAAGLRVPEAVGDFLMLRAVRESGGRAVAVSEGELVAAQERLAAAEGICACPEAGAALAALERLVREGWIGAGERVVLFNTGSGMKYEEWPGDLP